MGSVDDFYATPHGRMVQRLLGERLTRVWPSLAGMDLLGVGYPTPYMTDWSWRTRRSIALVPPPQPAARWPADRPSHVCAASEEALPFPDLSFDRILVVHALENAESARKLLRELWRVLRDNGRLLLVVPNRRGMWAHVENTPFGQGQPYSSGQITRLLAASLFRVERREAALFVPPLAWNPLVESAGLWEALGRAVLPPWVAGLTLAEAVKDIYAAVPVAPPQRRRVLAEAS